jgi:hypothetical protein
MIYINIAYIYLIMVVGVFILTSTKYTQFVTKRPEVARPRVSGSLSLSMRLCSSLNLTSHIHFSPQPQPSSWVFSTSSPFVCILRCEMISNQLDPCRQASSPAIMFASSSTTPRSTTYVHSVLKMRQLYLTMVA